MAEFLKESLESLSSFATQATHNVLTLQETAADTSTDVSGDSASTGANNTNQQDQTVGEMLFTMRLVSFICNFWTIILVLVVISKLANFILQAKKKRDLKRKKLYLTSILFVSYILV